MKTFVILWKDEHGTTTVKADYYEPDSSGRLIFFKRRITTIEVGCSDPIMLVNSREIYLIMEAPVVK